MNHKVLFSLLLVVIIICSFSFSSIISAETKIETQVYVEEIEYAIEKNNNIILKNNKVIYKNVARKTYVENGKSVEDCLF